VRPSGDRRRRALCVLLIFDQFAYTPGNGIHQPFFFLAQTRWWCMGFRGLGIRGLRFKVKGLGFRV